MTDPEIVEKVHRILLNEFEVPEDTLLPNAHLYDELGLDSLDTVDLMVVLEKEFLFKIDRVMDEEKIREIRTIEELLSFIEYKRKNDGQPTRPPNFSA